MSTDMTWETVSTSSGDTEKLGELLGKLLRRHSRSPVPQASGLKAIAVIELRSDLGGGKTTFVKGLARGFGSKDRVASPTFTLNKIYKGQKGEIHHFDFYRLRKPGVLADQLDESLNDPKVVTVVEWSDIVKDVLPTNRLAIEFQPRATDPDERQIIFYYHEPYVELIKKLQSQWVEADP